jgi:hypothetical protein
MNKKIRELAEQANWLFADKVTGEFTDYDKRIQKFAELIVKECMQIIKVDMYEDAISNMWSKNKLQMIKKHFGVEE